MTTHIPTAPALVWPVLTDTSRWPQWDPALERVDGDVTEGARIAIHLRDSTRPFRSRVRDLQPERGFVLRGGMPLGLFTGTRTYTIRPETGSNGTGTMFSMTEEFTGPLSGLIGRSIPDLQPSFDAFAAGLVAASINA